MKCSFTTPNIVQRLGKPVNWKKKENFSFETGVIVEKGLCSEVGDIFENIMDFEYMGSSEFEWGHLPASLEYAIKYAKNKDYIACEIDVTGYKGTVKSVYYICHKDMEECVVAWLKKAGKGEHPKTQEGVRLERVIEDKNELSSYIQTCGWYDLENRFWFFTNRKMFLDVKKLFGV